MKRRYAQEFNTHRDWFTTRLLSDHFVPALQKFIEQMSAVSYLNATAIGGMFDAKSQMETLRQLQLSQYETYKDYQPSKSFCAFGTNVRSLHSAEARADYAVSALGTRALKRSLGQKGTATSGSKVNELSSRWLNFKTNYCRMADNNTGMMLACGADGVRPNADISYAQLIETQTNISGDFTNVTPAPGDVGEGVDIKALMANLFNHDIQTKDLVSSLTEQGSQEQYMALRSITAKRSVAESSFSSIVGLKNEGAQTGAANFLTPIVEAVGGSAADVGDSPSYYAQLEVLTKRLYQNPYFFARLYDSQINTERKGAAMKAIELMIDRAIAESEMRQEMTMSVLLSSRMRSQIRDVEQNISEIRKTGQ